MAKSVGVVEWFRIGEYDRVERAIEDLKALDVEHLRTGLYWADYLAPEGAEWYDWLLPRLARQFDILPCAVYTPPSLGITPSTSSPPRNTKDYADFLDHATTKYGRYFEAIELWNEPNNLLDWDWMMDPQWDLFCDMIGKAAYWMKHRGRKTILGGTCPVDCVWLDLMGRRGILQYIDVVGIHGFPGTWEVRWNGWQAALNATQEQLDRFNPRGKVWITEAGYSTWRHDEHQQVVRFLDTIDADCDRTYWYALHDLHPDLPHQQGFHEDERHYHMGLKRCDGSPKLLFRAWAEGGLEKVRDVATFASPIPVLETVGTPAANGDSAPSARNNPEGRNVAIHPVRRDAALITGGAGFIGTNVARRILDDGGRVLIFDNLARPGVENNLRFLRETYGNRVEVEIADTRNRHAVRQAVRRCDRVFHFAAQVAVTTSLVDPMSDFRINVEGTLNLLEEIRLLSQRPSLLFTSTNKVYGGLEDVPLRLANDRYEPHSTFLRRRGIDESRPLDFHSPYGCSKGAADQYVVDYARCYSLPTVVFRMSCIYGPHQCGNEDQGWVAHFLIQTLDGKPITIFGDGCQVRDILCVEDLAEAMLLAHDNIDRLSGAAFNMGGGPQNAVSLREVLRIAADLHGEEPLITYDDWRTGDQRYYVSDTSRFEEATGWFPKVNAQEGITRLYNWLSEARTIRRANLATGEVG